VEIPSAAGQGQVRVASARRGQLPDTLIIADKYQFAAASVRAGS
jgi:hypothetical protein